MKRTCILALMLICAAMTTFAAPYVSDADYNETALFATPKGAEVRILMLEKQIAKNIADGEDALSKVNGTNVTDHLGTIIDELAYILNEATSLDLNKTPKELAEDYILLKAEARDLTAEFRQLLSEVLTAPERNVLRMQVRDRDRSGELDARLQNAINEYNAEQLGHYCEIIDCDGKVFRNRTMNSGQLQEELADGTIGPEEVVEELTALFSELEPVKQVKATQQLTERAVRNAVAVKALQARISTSMTVTFQNRLTERHRHMGILSEGDGLHRVSKSNDRTTGLNQGGSNGDDGESGPSDSGSGGGTGRSGSSGGGAGGTSQGSNRNGGGR